MKSTVRVKLYVICTVLPNFAPKNWSGSPVFKDTMLSGVLRSTSQIHNLIVAAHKWCFGTRTGCSVSTVATLIGHTVVYSDDLRSVFFRFAVFQYSRMLWHTECTQVTHYWVQKDIYEPTCLSRKTHISWPKSDCALPNYDGICIRYCYNKNLFDLEKKFPFIFSEGYNNHLKSPNLVPKHHLWAATIKLWL